MPGGGEDEACADEPLEGFERLYVSDPFGNRIELTEPRATWKEEG